MVRCSRRHGENRTFDLWAGLALSRIADLEKSKEQADIRFALVSCLHRQNARARKSILARIQPLMKLNVQFLSSAGAAAEIRVRT